MKSKEVKKMDEDGEGPIPNMQELKMQIFEAENPHGAELLKKKVDKKMKRIQKIIEAEVDKYFIEREKKKPQLNYIG